MVIWSLHLTLLPRNSFCVAFLLALNQRPDKVILSIRTRYRSNGGVRQTNDGSETNLALPFDEPIDWVMLEVKLNKPLVAAVTCENSSSIDL